MAQGLLHSGIIRRVPGRKMRASASITLYSRRRQRIASQLSASTRGYAAGRSRQITCPSGPLSISGTLEARRSRERSAAEEAVQDAPRQLVVDADPNQMVVDGK